MSPTSRWRFRRQVAMRVQRAVWRLRAASSQRAAVWHLQVARWRPAAEKRPAALRCLRPELPNPRASVDGPGRRLAASRS